MIDFLTRLSRQPEYIHVLINPLPIYGLAMGLIGLIAALILRSHRAQVATLTIILVSAASAWPVYEFGEQSYDRVLSMTDEDGHAWLDEHSHRAGQVILFFYALAGLSAVTIVTQVKWPRISTAFTIAVLLLGVATLGLGGYVGYAGGKIRHREFRNEPPPKKIEPPGN